MPPTRLRPDEQRLPPALNIVALATFAASLSGRALDPVLPHVASDFNVSIAAAAGFASVFAFTFAIIQPVLARAAVAVGVAGVFIETHPDPDRAPSDGPNMVPLRDFESLVRTLMGFDALAKKLDKNVAR